MQVTEDRLRDHYADFRNEQKEEFSTERIEKKEQFKKLLSEENIRSLEEGDVRQLVRNLWAFRGWTNKDYIVDQILETGLPEIRETFCSSLFETETVSEKFDLINENVNMLGPASVTEILTFHDPGRCAIYNRRASEALDKLGYEVPTRLSSGSEYERFIEKVADLQTSLKAVDTDGVIQDLLDTDYFLFYISTLDSLSDSDETSSSIDDFDHDEVQQKLVEIGDGLGFEVEDEYEAGPGARLDVRWRTRVANLGVISYAFEVHRNGSRDSALLNLLKAQNADPTLQKLVVVSTKDQIEKFEAESNAISSDLSQSISYFEVGKVNQAEELLDDLKTILQGAGLMGESWNE